eukprot:scaffold9176_cov129-Cylindrotheca_fusiformis.AAC.16
MIIGVCVGSPGIPPERFWFDQRSGLLKQRCLTCSDMKSHKVDETLHGKGFVQTTRILGSSASPYSGLSRIDVLSVVHYERHLKKES